MDKNSAGQRVGWLGHLRPRVAKQGLEKKVLLFAFCPSCPAPDLVPLPCRAGTPSELEPMMGVGLVAVTQWGSG